VCLCVSIHRAQESDPVTLYKCNGWITATEASLQSRRSALGLGGGGEGVIPTFHLASFPFNVGSLIVAERCKCFCSGGTISPAAGFSRLSVTQTIVGGLKAACEAQLGKRRGGLNRAATLRHQSALLTCRRTHGSGCPRSRCLGKPSALPPVAPPCSP
jgi:hypothetical protein